MTWALSDIRTRLSKYIWEPNLFLICYCTAVHPRGISYEYPMRAVLLGSSPAPEGIAMSQCHACEAITEG